MIAMSCDEIVKALVYLWLGDSKEAEEISKLCIESTKNDIANIKDKIKELKLTIEEEYLLPKTLREKGIITDDLIKVAMFELSRRIRIFSGDLSAREYEGIKYNIFNHGYKSIIKAYCKDCSGYKFKQFENGFVIGLDGVIYGEFLGVVDEKKTIAEIAKLVK